MDSPVPLMHHDPDRSWITDPDPDHPKSSLLRRQFLGSSHNLPSPQRFAQAKGTFLALCLLASQSRLQTLPQRSTGDHVKISLQPIGAGFDYVNIFLERSSWCALNFSGSKVPSCDQDSSKQRARNVPLASADVHGGGGCMMSPKNVCLGGYSIPKGSHPKFQFMNSLNNLSNSETSCALYLQSGTKLLTHSPF